jgi:L-alanine-DL-glutamate epimerase-like enolase superfamily enzyme
MNITDIEAIHLRLPRVTSACDGTQDTLLVRVRTDAGLTGYGEVDSCPSVARAVIEAPLSHQICRGLRDLLAGEDPFAIEALNRKMYEGTIYFGRRGAVRHAMAGVDMALWDLKGKALRQPVYRLLGGPFGKSFKAYASVLFEDTPEATGDRARRLMAQGFQAIKFGWGPMGRDEATDIALVREARKGMGDDADLMVDAGLVYDAKTAIRRARQFSEYGIFWLEEPLHPDDLDGYRRLSEAAEVRIAAGEQEADVADFERLMDIGGIDVVQPDPARCGISGMLAIGRAAARRKRVLANHTFKSGISLAASLHVLAALPNAIRLEYCMAESPLRHDLTAQKFPLADGRVCVPEEPGLGVDVDEAVIRKYRVDAR